MLVLCVSMIACGRTPRTGGDDTAAAAFFAVARDWEPHLTDPERDRAELERIVARVAEAASRDPGASRADVLNRTIFGELGFVREVDDPDLRFVLLPSVLTLRRGSCVGLGTLYLAIAERLGWHARGVIVPGHFFVRLRERGSTVDIELLRQGEKMSAQWYRERFPIPGGGAAEYERPLALNEVVGVIEYDVGNARKRAERFTDARRAYRRSREHFPDFAEAHASLGVVAHLLGALDEARAAYEAARKVNPNLPGIQQNVDLLDAESSAH
jgi:tetratricopeptide (TPR) repeat protein